MQAHTDILTLLQAYFGGIYTGNVETLGNTFHPHATLFGEVRGQYSQRPVADYLAAVSARQSPKLLGQPYLMEVLSIEVVSETAMAKVRCRIYDFNYYDFLSLIHEDGQWRIVNKLYSHIQA